MWKFFFKLITLLENIHFAALTCNDIVIPMSTEFGLYKTISYKTHDLWCTTTTANIKPTVLLFSSLSQCVVWFWVDELEGEKSESE